MSSIRAMDDQKVIVEPSVQQRKLEDGNCPSSFWLNLGLNLVFTDVCAISLRVVHQQSGHGNEPRVNSSVAMNPCQSCGECSLRQTDQISFQVPGLCKAASSGGAKPETPQILEDMRTS